MATPSKKPGPLAEAAALLEADLQAFEAVVLEASRVRLDTRKNLERSAREVHHAAELYERMQTRVGDMAARLQAAHERTLGAAGTLQEHGAELARRQTAYVEMLAAHEALMRDAAALTALAGLDDDARQEMHAGLAALAVRAGEMVAAARAAGFRDLADEATARHQQLTALTNRLGQL